MRPSLPTLLAVCLALMPACNHHNNTNSSDSRLTPVTLRLNWFPEAEHGGYYAAKVHGYFEAAGLDVELLPGGPGAPVVQDLDTGKVDFVVTNAERVALGQMASANIVSILAPLQNSPRCIMVHRETGISKLEELKDVTLAVGSGPAFYRFMARRLPLENVQTVAYSGSIGPFLTNPRYAQQAYTFSEPYLAKEKGADPVSLLVSEIGYNPYESCLATTSKTIAERPHVVARMVRASVNGWRHYLRDPQATNLFIQSVNAEMDADVLEFGATEVAKLCISQDVGPESLGQMRLERWQQLVDQLHEIGLVDLKTVAAERLFTNDFLTGQVNSQPAKD